MKQRIYYIDNEDFEENWLTIKEGILITIFTDEDGVKIATIREPIDKYRPEHFHDISVSNIKKFEENEEIDFLNNLSCRIHERLEDVWDNLEEVEQK